jgi:hypothetical protein
MLFELLLSTYQIAQQEKKKIDVRRTCFSRWNDLPCHILINDQHSFISLSLSEHPYILSEANIIELIQFDFLVGMFWEINISLRVVRYLNYKHELNISSMNRIN